MLDISATVRSARLSDLLCADCVCEVQAVFRSSLNLVCGERLLHIGSSRKGLVPFGVAVDPAALDGLLAICRQGQRVTYVKEQEALVWAEGAALSLTGARIYPCEMPCKRRGAALIRESLAQIRPLAEQLAAQKQCGLDLSEMALQLTQLRDFMKHPRPEAVPTLDYWIGRGPGLTPSGDDLLVGMLSVLWWGGCRQSASAVKAYMDGRGAARTTLVSREYLWHAVRGSFSQELIRLMKALEGQERISDPIRLLLEVGHTSGADTLTGVSLALELLLEEMDESGGKARIIERGEMDV